MSPDTGAREPLTPLYWCRHWGTLNKNKCDTCQAENGTQTAYYRASEVDAALAAGVGVARPAEPQQICEPEETGAVYAAEEQPDARTHTLAQLGQWTWEATQWLSYDEVREYVNAVLREVESDEP